jgi:hypothetical protein
MEKCQLCAGEIVREYKVFINADSTEELSVCGRCSILTEISDNIKRLLEKPSVNSFSPVMEN